ncbi:S8 family serine peptidase [Rubrivirga sp.]|uniref:S8 family serine peptidase n=1 Tax=Rubrivirga sp. TaxID=1885344 RepID=UPI003B51BED6
MKSLYRLLVLCAVAALAVPAQAQTGVPLAESSADMFDALAAKAAADGDVRVIISLNVAFAPEGLQPASAVQAQRSAIQRAQAGVLSRLAAPTGVIEFRFTPALAVTVTAADLAQLRAAPEVLGIEEDVPVPATDVPASSPMLDESTVLVGARAAQQAGFDGSGFDVAVLDTGAQTDHPFLDGQTVAEGCFSTTFSNASFTSESVCPDGSNPDGEDEQTGPGAGVNCSAEDFSSGCDHGTHVSGIAVGKQSGETGPMTGVAPGAGLVSVQVFSGFTAGCSGGANPCVLSYTSDQIRGLEYVFDLVANEGRNIASANMSLGGGRFFSEAECDAANASRKAIIDNLLSVGVATAISSGNNGYQDSMGAPGCISTAVSVGSTTKADGVSSFSNIAPFLDLLAPGSSILSSVPTDNYAFYNGTSMSAPHVAGAFAILNQRFPEASPEQLLGRLKTSGVRIPAGSPSALFPRIQIDDAFLEEPELVVSPTSVDVTLALDEETTEVVTLSNTADDGSVALSFVAELQNVEDQTGMPVSNACTAGQELIQASRNFFTTVVSGGQELGQSFTVPCTGTLTSVSPAIFGGSPAPSFSATLRVYEGAGTGGTELASVPITVNNPPSEISLEITLPEPINVEIGETYTWFLDLTAGETRQLFANTNPYAGGNLYFTTNGDPASASMSTNNDVQFKVEFGAPLLWLSAFPTSGTIEPGESDEITLGIDATGYPEGTYTGDLVIMTNDPDNESVTVPVTMTVVGGGGDDGISILVEGPGGFRYFGPPAEGVTVDSLAAQNLVRGVPGYYPAADPANLFTEYDATTNEWIESDGTGEVLELGKAFRWRFYDRAAGNPDVSVSVPLPFTLSTSLEANEAPVTVELQTDGTRFNYLANPFGEDLSLTGIMGWPGAENLAPIPPMTYDPVARMWEDGATSVAPWEAFRVRSKGPRTIDRPRTLTIPANDVPQTAARTAETPSLAFTLSGTDADGVRVGDGALTFAFANDARAAFDADEDAEKLQPLAASYALVGARAGRAFVGYDVRPFANAEIPLAVEARGTAAEFTLSWEAEGLPVGLPVVLVDLASGQEVDVRSRSSYTFRVATQPALAELSSAEVADGAEATDRFVLRIGTGLASAEAGVTEVGLDAVAPNPSSGGARVSFAVPEAGAVRVSVIDVRGREVAVLMDGSVSAGRHEARLDGGLAAGVYVVRLEAAGQVLTRQAVVVR